jgi:hypothetical protein
VYFNVGKYSVIWNFSKVKGSTTGEMSFGNMPTLTDYILTAKEEEVVDSAFQHRRWGSGCDLHLCM